jgi:alpha-L-fucosidase
MTMGWFNHAGLGLFVHWDHASQQGLELSWPLVGRRPFNGPRSTSDGFATYGDVDTAYVAQ